MLVTRYPCVKAALIWVAAALHVLQVVDEVSGLHLIPPSVGDTGAQFCMLTHGCLVFVRQDDLLALGPQLVQSWHLLGENHPGPHEMCTQGLLGCLVTQCVSYWGCTRSYSGVWIISVSISSDAWM